MALTFGSLFDGIGGINLAMRKCGAESSFSVEIDTQCNSVRRRHWPDEEQHTDVTAFTLRSTSRRPDIVCAGWPCQGNSVAGKRGGMADERSGLWGEVKRVLSEFSPAWFLGENVPGILSVNGGVDWLTVLRDLAELGYGTAYRILDAQWFGVAQRRRRVFVVGCLGDWRRAAEVLFESDCLPWHPAPSREAGARAAACLTRGTDSSGKGGYAGRRREDDENLALCLNGKNGKRYDAESESLVVNCLDRHMGAGGVDDNAAQAGHIIGTLQSHSARHGHAMSTQQAAESNQLITHTLRGEGCDASEGTGRGTPNIPTFGFTQSSDPNNWIEDAMPPITLRHGDPGNVAYQCHGSNVGPMGTLRQGNGNESGGVPFTIQERAVSTNPDNGPQGKGYQKHIAFTLESRSKVQSVAHRMAVRRLLPRECERLQGLPDDWTRYGHDGKEISDSARYRMIGNSVAVPCVEWIGRRIVTSVE